MSAIHLLLFTIAEATEPAPAAPKVDVDALFAGAPPYAQQRCRSHKPNVAWIVQGYGGGAPPRPGAEVGWTILVVDGAEVVRSSSKAEQATPTAELVVVDLQQTRSLRADDVDGHTVRRTEQKVRLLRADGTSWLATDEPFTWTCEQTDYPPRP